MYTRCPACLTVFRISSADLRAADGEVVCGRCDAQFNALASLSETPEEATAVLRPPGNPTPDDPDLSQTGAEPLWDVVARGAVAAGPGALAPGAGVADAPVDEAFTPKGHEDSQRQRDDTGEAPVPGVTGGVGDESEARDEVSEEPVSGETGGAAAGHPAGEGGIEAGDRITGEDGEIECRAEPGETVAGEDDTALGEAAEDPTAIEARDEDGDDEAVGEGDAVFGQPAEEHAEIETGDKDGDEIPVGHADAAFEHDTEDHSEIEAPHRAGDDDPAGAEDAVSGQPAEEHAEIEARDEDGDETLADDEATDAGEPSADETTAEALHDGEDAVLPSRAVGAAMEPAPSAFGDYPGNSSAVAPSISAGTDSESADARAREDDVIVVDATGEEIGDVECADETDSGADDDTDVFSDKIVLSGDDDGASPEDEGTTADEGEITLPSGIIADDEDTLPGDEQPPRAGAATDPEDVEDEDTDLEAALEAELNALADEAAEEWAVTTGVTGQAALEAAGITATSATPADVSATAADSAGADAMDEVEIVVDDGVDPDLGGSAIGEAEETADHDEPDQPFAVETDGAGGRADDADVDDSDLEFDVPQDQWDQIWDAGPATAAAGAPDEDATSDDDGAITEPEAEGEVIVLESRGDGEGTEEEAPPQEAERGLALPGSAAPTPFSRTPEPPAARPRWWLAAAVLLGLSLGLQWIHYNRSSLLTHPALGPALGSVYGALGIDARPAWELGSFRILESAGVQDPANPGTLKLSVRFTNSAPVPQPFPLLRVTLEDRWGEPVAMRDFAPREYIASVSGDQRLSPGQATQGHVTIVDPGPTADGYRLDLCYADGSQGAYCLGDLPGR